MEFDKSAWDDFEVDPRGFTEEDRAIIRAYIAAHKEQKKQQQEEMNKRKRKYEPACRIALIAEAGKL